MVIGSACRDLSASADHGALALMRVCTETLASDRLVCPQRCGYCASVSESGDARRFGRREPDPVTLTDVAAEDAGDGSREWCFTVRGLDDTVQAARFRTRREAERAHRRFERAMELLGQQITR